ncbi:carbon-nitrogen hydrolase family protein [Microbacterium sp. cx-55]|uniref:carbon-nitrogen hydrolase family protein n=1 Tax=Microbacterium sp. cx-55 TaxID=2875948 RepID=UPI001CBC1021|nr:carbon-nitrogen hydrolase family protein [Microbacterium sp. cx-55]MBZ4485938.1 carbon-nitrogen hydrolase family protein [Microbacterium sp. cx-55]UGB34187.1 carbon-nitrogen hydrolase family protein [Microbacterium sp. cx-55]
MTLVLAVAQFAPTADRAANLEAIDVLASDAAQRGARVVVFPEYASYFTDPFDHDLRAHAEAVDGPFTRRLARIAARDDITVVAGLVEAADDGRRVHNTVVAVDGSGVLARYRKQHLYDAYGQRESEWIAPGALDEPEVFTVDGIALGIMTCYDLRFPEAARRLVDAGAQAFLVPAEWVRGPLKEAQWTTLLHARAIENTAYVAAADHPPPLGVGGSTIIDPQGVALATIGTATGVAVAVLDAGELDRIRRLNPALALRRYEVRPKS